MFKVTTVSAFETAGQALVAARLAGGEVEIKEVNGEQELPRTIQDLENIVTETGETQPSVEESTDQVSTEEELVEVEIKLSENPELAKTLDEARELSEEDKQRDTITVGVSKEDAETMEELNKIDEPTDPVSEQEPEPETTGNEGEKVSGNEPSQPQETTEAPTSTEDTATGEVASEPAV